jgi:putative endonuclease
VPSRHNARLGRKGEDAAVELLRKAGYVILGRNLRLPDGEIDVVCLDGDDVVFVEVKSRSHALFGTPLGAVDARKRAKLRALAADYLQIVAPGRRARFDVVTYERGSMRLHKGAFS